VSLSIPFHFSIFFAFTVRHVLSKWLKFILTAPIYEVKFPLQFKKLKGKNTLTQFCDRSHVTSSTGHLLLEPFTVTVRHLIYLKVFNVFKHAYRSSCYQLVHISIRTGYRIEHIYWMCESFNTLSHFQSRLTLQWQYLHRHWTSTFPPMYLQRVYPHSSYLRSEVSAPI
jgi:hypothetical protein